MNTIISENRNKVGYQDVSLFLLQCRSKQYSTEKHNKGRSKICVSPHSAFYGREEADLLCCKLLCEIF